MWKKFWNPSKYFFLFFYILHIGIYFMCTHGFSVLDVYIRCGLGLKIGLSNCHLACKSAHCSWICCLCCPPGIVQCASGYTPLNVHKGLLHRFSFDFFSSLYEESFECVYRFYQQKGLASCNKAVLEKNVIWMTNSINSVISKRYGQNFTEPDVVQTCIGKYIF